MPFDRRSQFSSAPRTGSLSLTLTCSTGRVASPGPESCEAGGAEPPTQLGKRQIQCLDLGLGLWGLGLRLGSFVDAKKSLHPPENTNNSSGTFKTMSICRNKQTSKPARILGDSWEPLQATRLRHHVTGAMCEPKHRCGNARNRFKTS